MVYIVIPEKAGIYIETMDKNIIRNNFSKSAATYDDHAIIQKRCGHKLITLLEGRHFLRICEIGCGTGIYTDLLYKAYPDAEIMATDISEEMVRCAQEKFLNRKIIFKITDAELDFQYNSFNLVTSNASLQWLNNLDDILGNFKEALKEDGLVSFSMYGPHTFKEFKEVLEHHFGKGRWLTSSQFLSLAKLEGSLKKHFRSFKLEEEYFSQDFLSLWNFLESIKKNGSRGQGLPSDIFIGKYRMRELEKTYLEKFGKIVATHHVFFCKAYA